MSDLAHELWAAAQMAPGEGIEDGVARIKSILPQWIKCSERMPDEKVAVLAWDGYDTCIAHRFRNYWNDTIGTPTHWMPLPSPPAEDE